MSKLVKVLVRVGQFTRILDSSNNLSISNITAMLMLAKVMTAPTVSMQGAGLALAAVLPYITKKVKEVK